MDFVHSKLWLADKNREGYLFAIDAKVHEAAK